MTTTLLLGVAVLVGASGSSDMGESGAAPIVQARAAIRASEIRAEWDGSTKRETGRGSIARLATDARIGLLALSASAARRSGGDWAKAPIRLGIGLHGALWRVLAEQDLTTPERVSSIEGRLRTRLAGPVVIESRATVYRYTQHGTHYGAAFVVLIGIAR